MTQLAPANDPQMRDRIIRMEITLENHTEMLEKTADEQHKSNVKLNDILLILAEQKGASKAIKVAYGIVVGIIGCISGMLGALWRHV